MYLKSLKIKNFRRIRELSFHFSKGVNILLGENNVGKTAIIDALRIMLVHGIESISSSFTDDDFPVSTVITDPIEISCVFSGLTIEDEAQMYEALVPTTDGFDAHLHVRCERQPTGRPRPHWWCGATEGSSMPYSIFDYISCIYLPPLRDPSQGLRPGRNSQVARLVRFLSGESDQQNFLSIARDANDRMGRLGPVESAKTVINDELENIEKDHLKQIASLGFVEPQFERIVGSLRPLVDNLSFELNGLGYNNLLFIATTIGTLQRDRNIAYRGILIEEPEAHLHPQLQTLLLNYLNSDGQTPTGERTAPVQVILSSHSPTFASQAELDNIISLNEIDGTLQAISVGDLRFDKPKKNKLERYLDATKAELFFARRIILVEGLSEALLLPILAKCLDIDLHEQAVTLVNTGGLNFDMFTPLYAHSAIQIPVAILTDGDPDSDSYPNMDETAAESSNVKVLRALETDNLKVFCAQKTLEYDLALQEGNITMLLRAYSLMHPEVGKEISRLIAEQKTTHEKAKIFFKQAFVDRRIAKPVFAENLSDLIVQAEYGFSVPDYIRNALAHILQRTPTPAIGATE